MSSRKAPGEELCVTTLSYTKNGCVKNHCSSPLIFRQEEHKISSSFAAWPAENYEVLVASTIYKRIDASEMLNIT